MIMNKKAKEIQPRKGLWIACLVIQGIAVLLLGRYLITLDVPTNILSVLLLLAAYAAIVISTINVIRGKTKFGNFFVALGALNIVATALAIGFLVFVAGLYDALHY